MPAHVLGWGGDEPTASWVRGVALMDRRVARRVDVAEGDAAGEANLDFRDGSSEAVDRPAVRRVSRRHPDDDGDTELSQPVPNSDQLVAEAVTLAAAEIKKDPQLCELVAHYWRLVPDEELVGRTPEEMLVATVSHRELAAQRLPGELKLRVGETRPHPVAGSGRRRQCVGRSGRHGRRQRERGQRPAQPGADRRPG